MIKAIYLDLDLFQNESKFVVTKYLIYFGFKRRAFVKISIIRHENGQISYLLCELLWQKIQLTELYAQVFTNLHTYT